MITICNDMADPLIDFHTNRHRSRDIYPSRSMASELFVMVNAAAFFEYPLDITVANRTNEVIKALTILGTIAPPVLCIFGIHSMNLKDRPFEEFPYGAEWAAAVT